MDEIYSKAVQVNVHLGEGDERTDVAVEAVNRLANASVNATVAKRIGKWYETMGIEYVELATMVREYEEIAEEVMRKLSAPDLLKGTEKRVVLFCPEDISYPFQHVTVKLLTRIRLFSRIPIR
jgi:ADP-dependent phosphofructokinase/glucokinase